ncbi:MAG: mreC [Frankiales bacterium]|nr:mreC [Frankiales bacterium]
MRGTRGSRLLLVVLLLTAFTLTTLDVRGGGGLDGVRRASDRVLGPAQNAVAGAVGSLTGDGEDESALRAEVARLTGELRRSEDLQRRVDELDRLLALRDFGTYPMVPAQVSSIGSAFGFASTVTIDAGSRDGIAPGQTVVDGLGLVGRTVRVGPLTSTVLLLTDPGFTAGARLTREGTIGLATGDGDGGLTYELVEGGRVAAGDALLTTGSDTFVPGVPVGRVTAVSARSGALVTTAEVEPFVDVSSLGLVGVVTEPPRGAPRVPLQPSPRP